MLLALLLELTYQNQQSAFQAEYNKAVSTYGKTSKQATEAKKLLESAESNYQKEVINTLKLV